MATELIERSDGSTEFRSDSDRVAIEYIRKYRGSQKRKVWRLPKFNCPILVGLIRLLFPGTPPDPP